MGILALTAAMLLGAGDEPKRELGPVTLVVQGNLVSLSAPDFSAEAEEVRFADDQVILVSRPRGFVHMKRGERETTATKITYHRASGRCYAESIGKPVRD